MKGLAFIIFLFSFSALALDFPVCKREADVARYRMLARTLSNDEADAIVKLETHKYHLRKVKEAEERVACNCDNSNPGLKDLIAFIDSDYKRIQSALLEQTSAEAEAAAGAHAREVLASCQDREHELHKKLLKDSEAAYANKAPMGTQAMDGFNLEGLRGFIRTEPHASGKQVKTFAFAGSQTGFDWVTNVANHGGSQVKRALTLHLRSAVEWVKAGNHIQCTGHSLGGGVAEGFCAAVMRYVRYDIKHFGDFMSDNRVKTVTFNGLGASKTYREGMKQFTKTRDVPAPVGPDSWAAANTLHYRVAGDPLAELTGSPHLMGTVFEKRAQRQVVKTASREVTGFRNVMRQAADGVDDAWRTLWGGRGDGAAQKDQAEICQASDDPLGAHDLKSCEEIVKNRSGWRISERAQVELDARY